MEMIVLKSFQTHEDSDECLKSAPETDNHTSSLHDPTEFVSRWNMIVRLANRQLSTVVEQVLGPMARVCNLAS
jgi:hypothetical protein